MNSSEKENSEEQKKIAKLRKDLKKANARIKELEEQEKELETLRNELENANAKITELEEQERELETLHKNSENEVGPPTEQMADIPKIEDTSRENGRYGKEAFSINLYLREGHYQGIVSHVLSNSTPIRTDDQKRKTFKGVDHKAIADFINENLPQPEELSVAPEPVAPEPEKSPVETQKPAFKTASIRKFTLVREGKVQKERSIPHNQIFQVALVVDPLESIVEENLPCPYNISVHAKRMGGGFKQILGTTRGQITTAGELTANVHCASLPAGIYRFVAFGTINIKKDMQESIVQFHESSIFMVV
jgi:tetrahydromethanopterin S-methyltransferase subunit B